MPTVIMKLISIAALLLSFLWSFTARQEAWSVQVGGYLELLVIAVFATALVVVAQAARAHKYFWAAGFVAVVLLFNPFVPVTLSPKAFLWLDSACILMFLVSFVAFKTQPALSIPSIAKRTPGSESI